MGAKILTDAGAQALADVTAARAEQRRVRAAAEEVARRLVEETCLQAEQTLAEAVARARREGVPHSRIGREGLGTQDWEIVHRYAEQGSPLLTAAAA